MVKRASKTNEAILEFQRRLTVARRREPVDYATIAQLHVDLGEEYYTQSECEHEAVFICENTDLYAEALAAFGEYLTCAQRLGAHRHIAVAHRRLAETLAETGEYTRSVRAAHDYLTAARSIGDESARVSEEQRAEHVLGTILHRQADDENDVAHVNGAGKRKLLMKVGVHLSTNLISAGT
jgi:hypothetical protein